MRSWQLVCWRGSAFFARAADRAPTRRSRRRIAGRTEFGAARKVQASPALSYRKWKGFRSRTPERDLPDRVVSVTGGCSTSHRCVQWPRIDVVRPPGGGDPYEVRDDSVATRSAAPVQAPWSGLP